MVEEQTRKQMRNVTGKTLIKSESKTTHKLNCLPDLIESYWVTKGPIFSGQQRL